MKAKGFVAAVAASALIAAACGGKREAAVPATTAAAPTSAPATAAPATAAPAPAETGATAATDAPAPTEAPATIAPAGPMFGDMPWPCGPATEPNTDDGSELGVTAETITIGYGDDNGFAGAPGLNHEMSDAVEALAAKCNELGGIHGRKIELKKYEAALFEAAKAMQSACDDKVFFMVGQGWAFDSGQEEIRLACKLPSVPAYSVSAAFAHGDLMFQAMPNPADEMPSANFAQLAKLFPEQTKAIGVLAGDIPATTETRDKIVKASPKFGWEFVSTDLVSNPAGEADWTPFVKQLQDAGSKAVVWVGTCLPGLQAFAQAAKANGLDVPIFTDANHYTDQCAAANTDGAMDNVHLRMAFTPFEEASVNKATQDYLDLIAASGGDRALLGMQATAAFMLWATKASECGSTLTRACVLENLANTHEWTTGGLHVSGDPGLNHPPTCGMLLKLTGTTYQRVSPTEAGKFECDDSWVTAIEGTPALAAAALDEKRISRQFTPAG